MNVDTLKEEFNNLNFCDKIRISNHIDEELKKIKQENPQKYYSMVYYVKNSDKKVYNKKKSEKV